MVRVSREQDDWEDKNPHFTRIISGVVGPGHPTDSGFEHALPIIELTVGLCQRGDIFAHTSLLLQQPEELFVLPSIDWTQRRSITEYWEIRDHLNAQRGLVEDFGGTLDLRTLSTSWNLAQEFDILDFTVIAISPSSRVD